MRGLWAVVRRELVDKRRFMLAAVATAAIPPLGSPVFALWGRNPADVLVAFSVFLGVTFPLALALGLGLSVASEEVAGRRLSFDFARPLGAGAIWGGRAIVALLLPVVAEVVIFSPVLLLGLPSLWNNPAGHPRAGLWGLGVIVFKGCVVMTGLGGVAGGLYRTRSPLLAVDLALGAAFSGAFYVLGRRLVDAGGLLWELLELPTMITGQSLNMLHPPSVAFAAAETLAVGVVVLFFLAGFAQVAVGRTDPRRAHLALSGTLWGGALAALATAAAFTGWFLNPPPRDVAYRMVLPLAGGRDILLAGRAEGRGAFSPVYLIDVRDGGHRRIGSYGGWAVDGFPEPHHVILSDGYLSPRLVAIRAAEGRPAVVTSVALDAGSGGAQVSCVSSDGGLAVVRTTRRTRVVDTYTGKPKPGPDLGDFSLCSFEGRQRLVLYSGGAPPGDLQRQVVDLGTGARHVPVRFEGAGWARAVRDGRLVTSMDVKEFRVFDVDSGQMVWSHSPGGWPWLLSDGRVALVEQEGGRNVLSVLGPDGEEVWSQAIGAGRPTDRASIVAESAAGELVLLRSSRGTPTETLYVDPSTGEVRRRLEGLVPVPAGRWFPYDPSLIRVADEAIFVDEDEAVVHIDPGTGDRRIVLEGRTEDR
jgi:hypothetical protein